MDANNQITVPDYGEKANLEYLLSNQNFWSAIEITQKALENAKFLKIPTLDSGIKLATSSQELLESYMLRGETYRDLDYSDEFQSAQENIEFDEYDANSITIISKENNKLCGTVRLIMDGSLGLACEKHFSLDGVRTDRNNHNNFGGGLNIHVAEISRLIIDEKKQKGSLFFKMFRSIYQIGFLNDINQFVFSVIDEHIPIYEKFGGVNVLAKSLKYGNMPKTVSILHWDINNLKKKYQTRFNKSLIQ